MSLPIGQRRLTPVVILSLVVVAALGKKARPTGSLQALYDFSRADCLAGSFGKSSGKSASLGAVAVAGSGSHCLEGVGLGMDGARPGTAAASTGTISPTNPCRYFFENKHPKSRYEEHENHEHWGYTRWC